MTDFTLDSARQDNVTQPQLRNTWSLETMYKLRTAAENKYGRRLRIPPLKYFDDFGTPGS